MSKALEAVINVYRLTHATVSYVPSVPAPVKLASTEIHMGTLIFYPYRI
jgi:hypothetical protein